MADKGKKILIKKKRQTTARKLVADKPPAKKNPSKDDNVKEEEKTSDTNQEPWTKPRSAPLTWQQRKNQNQLQIKDLPNHNAQKKGPVKAGYRSGEHEKEMWEHGVNPDKLSSNCYKEKEFNGLYVDPNQSSAAAYGSQVSQVTVPAGTPIVRIENGLDPKSNPRVLEQIEFAKSKKGPNTIIEGIVDPTSGDLKTSYERIVPKEILCETTVTELPRQKDGTLLPPESHPNAPDAVVTVTEAEPSKQEKIKHGAQAMAAEAAASAVLHLANTAIYKNASKRHKGSADKSESVAGKVGSAGYEVLTSGSGTEHATLGAKAYASASVAKASARTKGIPGTNGLAAAFADAEALTAGAQAEASVLGAKATASASVGQAGIGFESTPLQLIVSAPGANAAVGMHASYIGASVGAHVAEASAGPFAVRAGFKVGASINNGVPTVDLGPISVCSIM